MLGINEVDHLLYIFLMSTMERESMKVRELTDAIAIEGIRQLVELDGLFVHNKMAATIEIAYSKQNHNQENQTDDGDEHSFQYFYQNSYHE